MIPFLLLLNRAARTLPFAGSRRIVLVDIGSGLVLSGVLPSVMLDDTYSAQLTTRGGAAPYTYSIVDGGLPDGLMLDPSTGIISGTAITKGTFTFTVRVTDLSGAFLDRQYSILVAQGAYNTLTLAGTLADATVGTAYSSDLTISGGDGVYSNARATVGSVPAGLALSIVGNKARLSGTPTGSGGTVSFTVAVDSGDGQTATSAQSVVVTAIVNYDDAVMADAPWAYWKLDEASVPFADTVGPTYPLGMVAGSVVAQQASLVGMGYSVGNNAYSQMGVSRPVISGDVAISQEIAIKLDDTSLVSYLIHTGDYDSAGNQGYSFYSEGGKLGIEFATHSFTSISTTSVVLEAGVRAVVGWSHNPATNQVVFYKNGVAVETVAWTYGLEASAAIVTVGNVRSSVTGYGAVGQLSRPAIYNYVLGSDRFLAHAHAAGLA